LDSVYQIAADHTYSLSGSPGRPTVTVPRTVEEFARYDVLILGRGYEALFDAGATEALKRWIADKGGNMVFLRGRADENTPALRDLEPVEFGAKEVEAARVRLTEAGRTYPGFAFTGDEDAQTVVRRLPSLISAAQVRGEKALAVVLARAES